MRLLGIDTETTGLDPAKDRVLEIGVALWDTDLKAPLVVGSSYVRNTAIEASPENIAIHGITDMMREEFGVPMPSILTRVNALLEGVERVVAHNAPFDRAFLEAEEARCIGFADSRLMRAKWLDTAEDIPFAKEPGSRKLTHLAAEHGFLNPFSHRAVFDALTSLRLLSCYPIADVIAYADAPSCVVRAEVSFDDKDLAKARHYQWERVGHHGPAAYPKQWVKRIKTHQLGAEKTSAPFQVTILG